MTESEHTSRRNAPRLDVNENGLISYSTQHPAIPCVVKDISLTGARLQVESVNHVPDTFRLIIDIDDFEADCIVVRRAENEVGVVFETVPKDFGA